MGRAGPSGTRGATCGDEPRIRGALAPAECQDLSVTEEQARLDFAVGLYSSRTASFARAAPLAGHRRIEFQRILAEQGIPLTFDSEDLEEDIATLKRLLEHQDRDHTEDGGS